MANRCRVMFIFGSILFGAVLVALIYTGFFCRFVYNGLGLLVMSAIGVTGICLSNLSLYFSERNKQKTIKRVVFWGFLLYCTLLSIILFGMRYSSNGILINFDGIKQNMNLIPFKEIYDWKMIVGNGFLFCPMGFFLPIIWNKQKTFKISIITLLIVVVTVETLQLLTGLGQFDIDDIILNVLGGGIGFYLWKQWIGSVSIERSHL